MIELREYRQIRPWHRARFWAWVLGCIACVYAALPRPTYAEVPWYQRPIFEGAAEVGARVERAGTTFRSWWRRTESSHEAQRAEQIAAITAREMQYELAQLREMVGLAESHNAKVMAARVVQHNLQAPYKMIVINRGSADGVERGMVAVAGSALVGRVERVASHHATVLLLTDPNHAVDVIVQRSRARGILVGRGWAATLGRMLGVSRIEYLEGRTDILPGDAVVTSGLDGRFPRGIPVGTVQRVERTSAGFLRRAEVVPLSDWTNIELVGLLKPPYPEAQLPPKEVAQQ